MSATMACLLDCAHHLERQFLRVRQTLDVGDVEPFIRAVAAQGRYMIAVLHLPNLDGSIIPATGEVATVRTGS